MALRTPASITAAATALIPLVGTLNASGNAAKQAEAAELNNKIGDALTQAANLAADDVVALLGGSNGPAAQLQLLDANAQAAATKIAADEAQVANAISFCTSAVTFVGAVSTLNFGAAATQLTRMIGALGIRSAG